MEDEFHFPKRKGKRGKGKGAQSLRNHKSLQCSEEKDVSTVLHSVEQRQNEMKGSDFLDSFRGILQSASSASPYFNTSPLLEIVCYGLGCFSSCVDACHQLCLLVCLSRHFTDSCVVVYDPLFSECEKVVLRLLGFEVLNRNEEGKRTVKTPTLFFAPHCSKSLYNNILWANWSVELLQRIMILGNSFSEMEDSLPKRIFTERFWCLANITHAVQEFRFPKPNQTYETAFNSLSVHIFGESSLYSLEYGVWRKPDNIVYEPDDELVLEQTPTTD